MQKILIRELKGDGKKGMFSISRLSGTASNSWMLQERKYNFEYKIVPKDDTIQDGLEEQEVED